MKRILSVLLCLCLTALLCAGCGSAPADSGRLKIVATIFPEYEWVKNIVGDAKDVEVSLLLDKGVDLHSFQPTTQDIVRIADCDVFVYIGGESDRWADDVLKDAKNRDMLALNLMEELGAAAKEEEAVEGMEPEKEAQEEEADEIEYDEHIWLSLKNAALLTQRIADRLGEKDEANKAVYQANAASYIAKLNELDGRYAQTVKEAKQDTLIFADRFPFRYLTDDYGLHYYAAFKGCSAESEASFQTLVFLADKLDSLGLHHLMIIDGSDRKIADAVIETAETKDVEVLTLDSMQSSVGDDDTYLGIMERNLTVLRDALN